MKLNIITKFLGLFKGTTFRRSGKEAESVNNIHNTEEFERCIMCGALTCIPVSMPIDWRENYEIGIGQICAECAKKQRKEEERESVLSTAQIFKAVEQSRKESNQ